MIWRTVEWQRRIHADLRRIVAAQDAGAGRPAATGIVELRKAHAVVRQPVDVGCLDSPVQRAPTTNNWQLIPNLLQLIRLAGIDVLLFLLLLLRLQHLALGG